MSKKIALITGASRGIGKGIVLALIKEGYYVIATSRDSKALDSLRIEVAHLVKEHTDEYFFPYSGDFTLSQTRKALYKLIKKDFGRLHVLVNNIPGQSSDSFDTLNNDFIKDAFNYKAITYFDSMKLYSSLMFPGSEGRIINIVGNNWKYPSPNMFTNSAINSSIANASKNASFMLAKMSITVNCIHPGFIETDRFNDFIDATSKMKNVDKVSMINEIKEAIPLSKIGQVEDVAALVIFLCSPFSSYITGQQISVDGGIGSGLL